MRANKGKILKGLRNSEAIDYYLSSIEDLEGIKRIVEEDKEGFEWVNEEFWEEKKKDVVKFALRVQEAHERRERGESVHPLELKVGVKPFLSGN